MSVALPAVNGTTILSGCRVGHSWAAATTGDNKSNDATALADNRIMSHSLSRGSMRLAP
jgi:hypothetical protein